MGDLRTTSQAAPDWSDLVGPLSLRFPIGGKGRCFFPGTLISPRLIKIAIASRMSLANSSLFPEGLSIEDCNGIPRTTLKELLENQITEHYGKRFCWREIIEKFRNLPIRLGYYQSGLGYYQSY